MVVEEELNNKSKVLTFVFYIGACMVHGWYMCQCTGLELWIWSQRSLALWSASQWVLLEKRCFNPIYCKVEEAHKSHLF